MKSISFRSLFFFALLLIAGITALIGVPASERVAMHAIDVAAAQMNQPYSVPDALERQMPAEDNHRAVVFALVLLLALVFAVMGLLGLYFGAPFLKNARGFVREFRRGRAAPARPPGAAAARPALPWGSPPPVVPALPAPPPEGAEDGVAWL